MTGFFQTKNWSSQPQNPQEALDLNMQIANKENWRIVQLVNGFYQTEYQSLEKGKWIDVTRRESIEAAEQAIDETVAHYKKRVEFANGPRVIKTFK